MLKAENLKKEYNGFEALRGIDLEVNPGEIYCLLGANGAGKSTTINIFLHFLSPSSGKAYVGGIDVSENPMSTKKMLAYLPEVVQLYPHLSGVENLDYFSRLAGYRYTDGHLKQLLDRCGLQEGAHQKRLSSYSKGMRQKVGLAIAIGKNAKALIMDEPTSGLDPRAVDDFSQLVRQFANDGGAVLMATHDIFNAVEMGTALSIMNKGLIRYTVPSSATNAMDLQKIYLDIIK